MPLHTKLPEDLKEVDVIVSYPAPYWLDQRGAFSAKGSHMLTEIRLQEVR